FEGDVKTRRAGIALPARPSTQLIVDAPRFVPFRTDNMKPAQLNNFFVFLVDLRLHLCESLIPLLGSGGQWINLSFAQNIARHEVRVSAQQNVRTTASHVGCDSHLAFTSCLRDDFG